MSAWTWYLLGAFLALAWKWATWIRTGKTLKKQVRLSTKEWLDTSLAQDKLSWAITIGVVWLVGSLYIDKALTETGVAWLDRVLALPVFPAAAFLLGALMEYGAPALGKWALSKIKPPEVP